MQKTLVKMCVHTVARVCVCVRVRVCVCVVVYTDSHHLRHWPCSPGLVFLRWFGCGKEGVAMPCTGSDCKPQGVLLF